MSDGSIAAACCCTFAHAASPERISNRRIYYVTCNHARPSGGVKVIFQHAEALVAAGFAAEVLGTSAEPPSWLPIRVPYRDARRGFDLQPEDALVFPEGAGANLAELWPCPARKLAFVQHPHGLFVRGAVTPWLDRLDGAIACSSLIARLIRDVAPDVPVSVIENGVDPQVFYPRPKALRIVAMGNRRKSDLPILRRMFNAVAPQFAAVPWDILDGRSEAEVADILGHAAVFLSLQHQEGWGLPALEAMASGAVVAGFKGGAGAQYATDANGLWCRDESDLLEAARCLEKAVALVAQGDPAADGYRRAGLDTAAQYSLSRMKQRVVSFWGAG